MNLIVGATGTLGGMIARRLLADRKTVRALARPGSTYQPLEDAGAQIAFGDLREPASLAADVLIVLLVVTALAEPVTGAGRPLWMFAAGAAAALGALQWPLVHRRWLS